MKKEQLRCEECGKIITTQKVYVQGKAFVKYRNCLTKDSKPKGYWRVIKQKNLCYDCGIYYLDGLQ